MDDAYFAYGSNLDPNDWALFCRRHDFDPDVMRPIGRATLPDETLVFDYRSLRRGGGALNICARRGSSVDGYLFAVPADGWVALDTKEGHPHRYRREVVTVLDDEGRATRAYTYRVIVAMREGFVAPTQAYLAVCRAGRAHRGLSLDALDRAAANALAVEG